MLNVSFVFSFEFVRSAQSMLGTVMCTPGALSGYRREAVMNCLEDWINQTFMGQPSDIGEDRAMTNMILNKVIMYYFNQTHTFTPTHLYVIKICTRCLSVGNEAMCVKILQ